MQTLDRTPPAAARISLPGDLQALDALLFQQRRIRTGDVVYRQGEDFHFVYVVRSGTFKSVAALRDGREQVTGFQFAGDILGLDALAEGRHATEARALEDSEICPIPYRELVRLATGQPRIRQVLAQCLGRQIVGEQWAVLQMAAMEAEERVASFVLQLSAQARSRGWSSREFHVRMSRADIGSYLGLSLETVSRCLSSLQRQGFLAVDVKHIRIVDLEGLERAFEPTVH